MSDNQPLFAWAFDRLADGTPTFAQVQEPDPFDGLDTQKLQPFLTQCFLNFWDHPDTFTNDSTKGTC